MSPVVEPPSVARPRRFQFGLIDLAEAVAGIGVIAALVAEFELGGACLAVLGLLLLGMFLYVALHPAPVRAQKNLLGCIAMGIVPMCCLIGWLLYSPVSAVRRSVCTSHLRQIGLGLSNYHDHYGQFPPPYIADAAGRPMHSWRVLILPFMDNQALYTAYDLSKPWDHPKNRLLAANAPFLLACPSAEPTLPGATHYFYVVGDRRNNGQGLQMNEILDDHNGTILVVESDTLSANWMEPRDLTLEEALTGVNAPTGVSMSSQHHHEGRPGRRIGSANVLMVDNSIRYIPENLNQKQLEALLTIDGGERVDWNDLRPPPPDYAVVWLPLVGLVYLVVVGWRHLRRSWPAMPDDLRSGSTSLTTETRRREGMEIDDL